MADLRTRTIRLAHARPDLRVQLLPLLKRADAGLDFSFVPRDVEDLGFVGTGAEDAAQDISRKTRRAITEISEMADQHWTELSRAILRHRDVDADPAQSRVAVGLALYRAYLQLESRVRDYFEGVPVRR